MRYYTNYLKHHGIKGQKWGVRRFQQPNGRLTAAGKAHKEEVTQKKGLTDNQKKALKIGAAVIGTALVAYGGYKIATNPQVQELTSRIIDKHKETRLSDISKVSDSGGSAGVFEIGKSIQNIDREMVSQINANGWVGDPPRLTTDCARNCSHTSIAYIMNSVLGMNVTAKGFGGVDEISGMVQSKGRNKNVFEAIFDGIESSEVPMQDQAVNKAISHIKNGTTGIIRVQSGDDGHFLNYEKDKTGKITFVDCQNGKLWEINSTTNYPNIRLTDIFDCSNASLKEDASNFLRHMVEYR